ncbi:galactosylgalactosylxylosylprotein 3-beta-glucuronosyltransferase S-like [Tigriopus californicus]|nr:galactosylgalactosylxylosylprotein 3-beta-glucuronosyltransferase S-like [Tigriopus californicus]
MAFLNRNAAIQFILSQSNPPEVVLYFADDDNTYDLRLFEGIRTTKKISMFPVGLVAGSSHSSPILKDGRLVGYSDSWICKRKFPMDMAGFAINIKILAYNPDRVAMPFIPSYEEDGFLKGFNFNREDVEALAENCTKVWVWHTTTIEKSAPTFRFEQSDTNLQSLFTELQNTGLIKKSDDGPHLPQCGIDSVSLVEVVKYPFLRRSQNVLDYL